MVALAHSTAPHAANRYAADINDDGVLNFFDISLMTTAANQSPTPAPGDAGYDPDTDLNADGSINSFDVSAFMAIHNAKSGNPVPGGWLTDPTDAGWTDNSIGYDGYHFDYAGATDGGHGGLYCVRHRVYDPGMGRWVQRDPLGYVDGSNTYNYGASRVLNYSDPKGTYCAQPAGTLPGDRDCSEWNEKNRSTKWLIREIPEPLPSQSQNDHNTYNELVRLLRPYKYDFVFPEDMNSKECFCWEKKYYKNELGRNGWLTVAGCAKLAKGIAGGLSNKPCQNFLRHCLYSCCLYERLESHNATKVLLAHEACTLYTVRSPDWSDFEEDLRGNAAGKGCAKGRCKSCCETKMRKIPGCEKY